MCCCCIGEQPGTNQSVQTCIYFCVQLIDAFDDPDKIVEEVERVSIWFAIIGLITLICSFFEVAMFMYTGEFTPPHKAISVALATVLVCLVVWDAPSLRQMSSMNSRTPFLLTSTQAQHASEPIPGAYGWFSNCSSCIGRCLPHSGWHRLSQ